MCPLKVLMLKRMKESMSQMGKERKLLSCHRACRTPPFLVRTPRTSSPPPSLPPPSRSSGLPTPSPPPPATPPWTPRSFSHLPPQVLHLHSLLLPWSPSWSAACRQSGGCRTRVWTRASSVSPGRKTAASFTDERDT